MLKFIMNHANIKFEDSLDEKKYKKLTILEYNHM